MQSRFAQSPIVAISSYIYSYSGYHRKYLQMSTPFSNFQRADILTKSIKKNLHMFIALLTYWHTHTHIYIYHTYNIYYIIYNIIIYLDKHFQVYSSNSCQKGPCEPCRKPQFLSGNVRDGMTIFWQAGPHSAMTSGGWKTMVFPIKKVPLRPLNQPS